MWELVYVLKKECETVELTEWADIKYYTEVLGYEIDNTYDKYVGNVPVDIEDAPSGLDASVLGCVVR